MNDKKVATMKERIRILGVEVPVVSAVMSSSRTDESYEEWLTRTLSRDVPGVLPFEDDPVRLADLWQARKPTAPPDPNRGTGIRPDLFMERGTRQPANLNVPPKEGEAGVKEGERTSDMEFDEWLHKATGGREGRLWPKHISDAETKLREWYKTSGPGSENYETEITEADLVEKPKRKKVERDELGRDVNDSFLDTATKTLNPKARGKFNKMELNAEHKHAIMEALVDFHKKHGSGFGLKNSAGHIDPLAFVLGTPLAGNVPTWRVKEHLESLGYQTSPSTGIVAKPEQDTSFRRFKDWFRESGLGNLPPSD